MRKYLEVFRWSFKMQIVWRFDVAMTMLATIGRILAAWIIWRVIYSSHEYVGGFSFEAMLSYYIVSSFLASLDFSNQISGEVSNLIKDGGFSKHMVTPMNQLGFFSFMVAGESAFHLGFSLAAAFFCALVFGVPITITASLAHIMAAIIMIPLGIMFMMCFQYLLGILAFRLLSIQALLFVAWHVTAFASGALVPLALLPASVQNVMKLLPFYHIVYLPAMLLQGRCLNDAPQGLFTLACWTAGFIILDRFSYTRLRARFEGVGI